MIQQKARAPLQDIRRMARERPQEFSNEQMALKSMFGGGGKIWGTELEPVKIYNDLHPSLSNPEDETRRMFGF